MYVLGSSVHLRKGFLRTPGLGSLKPKPSHHPWGTMTFPNPGCPAPGTTRGGARRGIQPDARSWACVSADSPVSGPPGPLGGAPEKFFGKNTRGSLSWGEQLPLQSPPAPRPAPPCAPPRLAPHRGPPEALSMVLISALGSAGWGVGEWVGAERWARAN